MTLRTPRDLPSVGKLMERPEFAVLAEEHGWLLLRAAVRDVLQAARRAVLGGEAVDTTTLLAQVSEWLEPSQRRVLNLTGTILHTNLGRAPLGDLLAVVASRLRGYSVLEYDLATGKRGKRGHVVERLLRWVTGAEAALTVNNCSAAMILLLTVLAKDREVVVSRGELVEIGGGFRIPDILELSGAKLREVGTTNRTRIGDFERALTDQTAVLLSTHRSNFKITGFTESPSKQELLDLGKRYDLPVVYDLGSGMLTSVVAEEPSVIDSTDFTLTAFSGDKLLGGPQCGVLLGRAEAIERCRKHPLYRAFRCDKVTLALLEEALRRHAARPRSIPTVALLTAELESLRVRAEALLDSWQDCLPEELSASVVETEAQVGGGSLPGGSVRSVAICFEPLGEAGARCWQERFRRAQTPIIVRVEKERVLLDLRALPTHDDDELKTEIRKIFT